MAEQGAVGADRATSVGTGKEGRNTVHPGKKSSGSAHLSTTYLVHMLNKVICCYLVHMLNKDLVKSLRSTRVSTVVRSYLAPSINAALLSAAYFLIVAVRSASDTPVARAYHSDM